mmetsp:Transcript_112758/g.313766  ORF Transcript_112758/g.313766 Transcript_112758/m.313766 type:complete len:200 (-) Transcript_112758:2-601(-)
MVMAWRWPALTKASPTSSMSKSWVRFALVFNHCTRFSTLRRSRAPPAPALELSPPSLPSAAASCSFALSGLRRRPLLVSPSSSRMAAAFTYAVGSRTAMPLPSSSARMRIAPASPTCVRRSLTSLYWTSAVSSTFLLSQPMRLESFVEAIVLFANRIPLFIFGCIPTTIAAQAACGRSAADVPPRRAGAGWWGCPRAQP